MTSLVGVPAPDDSGEFILYQTADGQTRIEVRTEHETVWLTQRDMAELFQTTVPNINQHLSTIYDEGELDKGFSMDDTRLKRVGGGNYFEELLARIRDIRSSERVFWRRCSIFSVSSVTLCFKTRSSRKVRSGKHD